MSLLLDALKKSGEYRKTTGLSDLSLEDMPASRSSSSTTASSASNRTAGEAMFAAKKKKSSAGFRWNLGLVPTTLIIALVFGGGYGYYVWLEIQPPSSQAYVAQRPTPPSVAPRVATAQPLVPFIPPQENTPAVQAAKTVQSSQPQLTARNDDFEAPRNKPRAGKPRGSRASASGIDFQRNVAVDTVTPALLEAWQAYQRGDYVTAGQGYRQALGKDAHNRDALLGMAAVAQQQGNEEAAQQYYRQLLVLDPRDPVAQSALMAYSPNTGNEESRLKLMLAEQPRSGALNFALGNHYAELSSWGDAQQYYFNAHTLEPTNAQFAFNLAVSLDHLGQRKLATQFYQQALQLDVSGNSGFDHAQAQQRLNELTTAR
jgi:Flp pilus assembly protein TadD